MTSLLDRYKLVVKDPTGKVIQIHEVYRNDITRKLMPELDAGRRVTITQLDTNLAKGVKAD